MKKKIVKKICFFCNKTISKNAKTHAGKTIHPVCLDIVLDNISKAYEIQKKWEESLSADHRKVLMLLQSSTCLTIFEISEQTKISLWDVQAILNFFKTKIKKTCTVKKGEMSYTYKYVYEPSLEEHAKNKQYDGKQNKNKAEDLPECK